MRCWEQRLIGSAILLLLSISATGNAAQATENSLGSDGSIKVEVSDTTVPVDPENPEDTVNPGEGPSTKGTLRIDYASSLDFGDVQITESERVYKGLAQQFFSDTAARGSYIQITDQRTTSTGWTLQVKQNHPFRNSVIQNADEQELIGSVLSLDKAWANSSSSSDAPNVTRETIALSANNTAYELATATVGTGRGIWTISFGASKTNTDNQEATLAPVIDQAGNPVIDELYNKPMYSNSAITLSIPEKVKIHPVYYETEITWILAALP